MYISHYALSWREFWFFLRLTESMKSWLINSEHYNEPLWKAVMETITSLLQSFLSDTA